MNTEKIEKLKEITLKSGSHSSLAKGACIMEMVSYFADEPWSDHPKCACPILTSYAISLNDRFNDEHRQCLKDFIPVLVNTKESDEIQVARRRLIQWRYITVVYPLILELFKLNDLADEIRKFENTLKSMAKVVDFLRENKQKIYAAADANAYANAYADAYAYAAATAGDANAYADAYAYAAATAGAADANAAATAAAYALREKIVAASLETLRLAIEIK